MNILQELASGKHPFCKKLSSAKRPMVVVGSGALQREDGAAIHSALTALSQKLRAGSDSSEWKVLNVLQRVRCDKLIMVMMIMVMMMIVMMIMVMVI